MERLLPRDGDVLVSHSMARVDCEIAVVPRPAHAVHTRQETAIANATVLAHTLGVDAWLTHDRRHFLRVASFRAAGGTASPDPARLDRPMAQEPAPR